MRMNTRYRFLAILLAFVLLLVAAPAGLAEGKVDLNIACTWISGGGDPWTENILATVEEFKAQNPNVNVIIDAVSHADYENTKFKVMASADALPTLFLILNSQIGVCADAGMLMSWDQVLADDPEWRDSFLNIWEEATFDGSVYGIPYQFLTNECMFYNKELLASVGYDTFPVYWDEFLDLCQKLKDAGKIPLTLGDRDAWPVPSHLAEYLAEYCCGPEWVKGIAEFDPNYNFSDPDFVKSVQMIEELVQKGYFNEDIASIDHNTEDMMYLFSEQAAMYSGGPWQIAGMTRDCPEDVLPKLDVAPMPAPRDAKSNVKTGLFTGGSGWEYACNSTSTPEQYEAAAKLVKMLTSSEFAAKDAEIGRMPVLKSEYVGAYDESKVPQLSQNLLEWVAKCPEIPPMNMQRTNPAVADVFYKKFQELVAGMSTAEEVVADIQAAYERVLQQN